MLVSKDDKSLKRRRFLKTCAGSLTLVGFGSSGLSPVTKAWAQERAREDSTSSNTTATGRRCVVATVHPLASQAALDTFSRGGNAIDAAVAASAMLSVVDGFNSGLGGGGLALIRTSDGIVHAYDGREKAPANSSPEMFYKQGFPDPQLSQMGPLAVGVPGLPALLERISSDHGKLSWVPALEGAAQVAEDGFSLDANYVGRLSSAAERLAKFQGSAEVLLDEQARPWQVGHRLQQPDLASTLRCLAEQGSAWFYEGEFAKQIEKFMQENGGVLRSSDMASYDVQLRPSIESEYRGHRVFGFPPPSSGGIHIAQMLGMLRGFDVAALFQESTATGCHLLLEVMKRAMADRADWWGDADFVKVPRGLIAEDYLAERAQSIELQRATPVASHGVPPRSDVDLFGKGGHTTHLTTADEFGNVVALTQTVNTTFGSKIVLPGTGVVLNNEMDDFSIAAGVRNAFGLLGSDANLVAPCKRPLSSMSPTIVTDAAGLPLLSCGAAGGPKIITTALQVLVRVLDLDQKIDEAIAAPRVHHQWSPDTAVCEEAWPVDIVRQLEAMGHQVELIDHAAVSQGVSATDRQLCAASDPRVPSSARGM